MNPDYEKRLEARVDQALKDLPALVAPRTLTARVMAAIELRAALPWYRLPWQMWPASLRAVSMTVLLASFGAVCFAAWQLTRAAGVSTAMQEVAGVFSFVAVLWNAVNVLLSAALLVVKHLGTGFILACLFVIACGYALCVGLGTVYVRLALARR